MACSFGEAGGVVVVGFAFETPGVDGGGGVGVAGCEIFASWAALRFISISMSFPRYSAFMKWEREGRRGQYRMLKDALLRIVRGVGGAGCVPG